MTQGTQPKASWTKQCCHCLRLLGGDGRYYDMNLTGPVDWFPLHRRTLNRLRVTPAICPECFGVLREFLGAQEQPAADPSRAAVA